ncbi:TVP38/TMEM64 family protein [Anoxynatronum buryatiense]|uniref:TVP38/TMEM64 family membrane protein n=1 Tax=Anoxynatronum buryatiense TaxID=489973 RepID=A0AA46AHM6_9CLOT|nr:VTT domain-containing protein [Anoxynatronum buryatiense]SMP40285.1 Uncharacterized membrane protein YdjX, TVP38/TMEM64 family, SNARE-associated domain [Anoxynatronum buryatiense]
MKSAQRLAQIVYLLIFVAGLFFLVLNQGHHHTKLHHLMTKLHEYRSQHYLLAACAFFCVRFLCAAFAFPGSGMFTLMGGALFGWLPGTFLVLLANSTGSVVVFLLSRYAFKESLEKKYQRQYAWIRRLSHHRGAALLFFLRVIEVAPSFAVNSFFALTEMRLRTYFTATVLGALPGILLFTNLGVQAASIRQLNDLVSPMVLASLISLALIPLLSSIAWYLARNDCSTSLSK